MKLLSTAALAVMISLGCFHSSANAAVPIAYVDSTAGNDANAPACARTTPCKTMPTALSAITNPGVVIVVADSEFAPFTIAAGASISCPSVACIVNSSGGATGITISAPGATDTVILTGVSVGGFGSGGTGINITSAAKVKLLRSSVSGNATGINFSLSSGPSSQLILQDSEVRYQSGLNISVAPTNSVSATAVITDSRIHNGRSGVLADGTVGGSGISMTFDNSTISFHSNNGIALVAGGSGCPGAPSGPFVRVQMTRTVVSYTGTGVNSIGCSAHVFLDASMVTGATTGVAAQSNGTVVTTSNNAIGFNTTNVSGTLGHIAPQ
jgi:hypothetical protein